MDIKQFIFEKLREAGCAAEWRGPHPPRHGCGCDSCYAWIVGRHAAGDRAPFRTWQRLYGGDADETASNPALAKAAK